VRLGLGHISEVSGRAGRAGIEAVGGDGWEAIGERDAGENTSGNNTKT